MYSDRLRSHVQRRRCRKTCCWEGFGAVHRHDKVSKCLRNYNATLRAAVEWASMPYKTACHQTASSTDPSPSLRISSALLSHALTFLGLLHAHAFFPRFSVDAFPAPAFASTYGRALPVTLSILPPQLLIHPTSFPPLSLPLTMGRPAAKWLSHLEAHEDDAKSPSKVEAGLIDARFAFRCDEWWNDNADSDASWHTKAVKNYKSAAATFWEAYEDETTPHIYKALSAAAKAASARAKEMEGGTSSTDDKDHGCGCDVCRPKRPAASTCDCAACQPARPVATTCHCAACRPRASHHHHCPVHGYWG